jgi:DNA-directed RNA polymerase beta subunit
MKPRQLYTLGMVCPAESEGQVGPVKNLALMAYITTEQRVPVMEFWKSLAMENLTDILPLKV